MKRFAFLMIFWFVIAVAFARAKPARPLYEPPVTDRLPAPTKAVKLREPEWSQYGLVSETEHRLDDGRPVYSLTAKDGRFIIFVITPRGKSLQYYVGRTVAVYGPTMTLSNPRIQCVLGTMVAPP
jgi:hypothetical protein